MRFQTIHHEFQLLKTKLPSLPDNCTLTLNLNDPQKPDKGFLLEYLYVDELVGFKLIFEEIKETNRLIFLKFKAIHFGNREEVLLSRKNRQTIALILMFFKKLYKKTNRCGYYFDCEMSSLTMKELRTLSLLHTEKPITGNVKTSTYSIEQKTSLLPISMNFGYIKTQKENIWNQSLHQLIALLQEKELIYHPCLMYDNQYLKKQLIQTGIITFYFLGEPCKLTLDNSKGEICFTYFDKTHQYSLFDKTLIRKINDNFNTIENETELRLLLNGNFVFLKFFLRNQFVHGQFDSLLVSKIQMKLQRYFGSYIETELFFRNLIKAYFEQQQVIKAYRNIDSINGKISELKEVNFNGRQLFFVEYRYGDYYEIKFHRQNENWDIRG